MYIPKDDLIKYLGYYKGSVLTNRVSSLIDFCIDILNPFPEPRLIHKRFNICVKDGTVEFLGSNLTVISNDFARHLNGCNKCIVFAVTVGLEADNLIRKSMIGESEKGVIFDTAFSAAVEYSAEMFEREIGLDENITTRYSPGYGDFSIEYQRRIVDICEASKYIGLSVTDTMILTPTKSITAIIGVKS